MQKLEIKKIHEIIEKNKQKYVALRFIFIVVCLLLLSITIWWSCYVEIRINIRKSHQNNTDTRSEASVLVSKIFLQTDSWK